jgi:succinoglycan biosynthesis transport protein ExoP
MSLGTLFLIVWKRRLAFFLAFLLISAGLGAAFAYVTPMFESEALLMISEDRSHQSRFPDALRYEINSEIYVIASDGVLRQAIESIGPQNLFPDRGQLSGADGPLLRLVAWFKDWALSSTSATDGSPIDLALLKVRKRLSVAVERDSKVVQLRFRDEDPKRAGQFLTLVVDAFLRRHVDISGNAAASSFFREQAARYRDDYDRASAKWNEFAGAHAIYSIAQEVQLALARRDETIDSLAKTRGSIADKEAQAATLQNTVIQLRRRIALPGEITGPKHDLPADSNMASDNKIPANESPLLLVRVFQETAQSLVALNAEMVGLRALEHAQEKALSNIEQRLANLSAARAEFERLKSAVDQAAEILKTHLNQSAQAGMDADWDESQKLANVKVVQAATVPIGPVFPQKLLFLSLAAVAGSLGGAAASVASETILRGRNGLESWREAQEFSSGAIARRAARR